MQAKRATGFSLAALVSLGLISAAAAIPNDTPKPEQVPGEFVVRFKGPGGLTAQTQGAAAFSLPGAKSMRPVFAGAAAPGGLAAMRTADGADEPLRADTFLVQAEGDHGKALRAIKAHPDVAWAEPNYVYRVAMTPNDYFWHSTDSWGQGYADLWGLKKIQVDKAWDYALGEGITVAVVDSGVDYSHPDIAANIWNNTGEVPGNGADDDGNGFVDDVRGWDFTTCAKFYGAFCIQPKKPDQDPKDGNGHGTHVAGIIAAVGGNGVGGIGVAPRAKIMALRGIGDQGAGSLAELAAAVLYAVDNGADVINNSWGGPGDSRLLAEVFAYARKKGVLAIAAAGNDNKDSRDYVPAKLDSVLTVGATDQNDLKASFSNYSTETVYGPKPPATVDVSAPGGGSGSLAEDPARIHRFVNILSLRAAGTDLFAGSKNYNPGGFFISDNSGVQNLYYRAAGTSMAAPHVAGLAALVMSRYLADHPRIDRKSAAGRAAMRRDAWARIVATADPLAQAPLSKEGQPVSLGSGRINAYQAVAQPARPYLALVADRLEERSGNGNGIPEAGEEAALILALENIWGAAGAVTAELSAAAGAPVQIVRGSSAFGAIASGQRKSNGADPFVLKLGSAPVMSAVNLELRLSAAGGQAAAEQRLALRVFMGAKKISATAVAPFTAADELEIPPYLPRLSGSKLVWTDTRGGDLDVYMHDLASGREQLLSREPSGAANPGDQGRPAISGNTVVWEDDRRGQRDICLLDLAEGGEPRRLSLPSSLSSRHQLQPVTDGRFVVWTSSSEVPVPSMDSAVYAYDLHSGGVVRLSPEGGSALNPDISNQHVVFEDTKIFGVFLVPAVARPGVRVGVGPMWVLPQQPRISGDRMVYVGMHALEGIDLYLANAGGKDPQSRKLTADGPYQSHPAIAGDQVVWQDPRSGDWDIYHRDLRTGETTRITNPPLASHFYPAVSDRYIAWVWDTVLWAAWVPGAPVLPQPTPPPSGMKLGVDLSVKFAARQGVLSLSLTAVDRRSGKAADLTGLKCSYAILGRQAAGAVMKKLGRQPADSGRTRLRFQGLPAIRARTRTGASAEVALQAQLNCPGRDGAASPVRPVKASTNMPDAAAPAKWIKILKKQMG